MSQDKNILIARIIASTKRKKRGLSILEIANDIQSLKEQLGGLDAVAKEVGISVGMLNQFLSVFKLSTTIQELVKKREVDSVALVFMMSKFEEKDLQDLLAPIINNGITSQELKVLLPYRKQFKSDNILELLERVRRSKNVKVSVIRFPKSDALSVEKIEKEIRTKIGAENYISTEEENGVTNIKISKKGEKLLRNAAKGMKTTFQKYILRLLDYGR